MKKNVQETKEGGSIKKNHLCNQQLNQKSDLVPPLEHKDSEKLLSMSKYILKEMENLCTEEKKDLALGATSFKNFDTQNETHRNYINFLVEKMKSYKEYTDLHLDNKDHSNNSKSLKILSTYFDTFDISKNDFKL